MKYGDTKTTRAWFARRVRARSPFRDRADAGRELAQRLLGFTRREDCVVLALPRGGVPVAFQIARKLRLPLDVLVTGKLAVQGREQQVFGAIAADHGAFLDYELIRAARLTQTEIANALEHTRAELRTRARLYRGLRKPLDVEGKTVILVDDGAATGASLLAGVHATRRMRPAQLILALPVCPAAACVLLERESDLLLALKKPSDVYAIGQFYLDFRSVRDEDVPELLDANVRGKTIPRRKRSGVIPGCAGT